MRILITGGSGFIGKKLLNRLLKEGHIVYTIDKNKLNTDDSPGQFTLDISDKNFIEKLNRLYHLPNLKIDHIYHVAAQS